jgi:Raf kinase inhibitor-like YbhB/YbcL family protein
MKHAYTWLLFFITVAPFLTQAEGRMPNGKFQLSSPAFEANADIPKDYTCNGGDINPPLQMQNIPAKTKSMALTMHDPDAPQGVWVHWVLYNIPPDKIEIPKNSIPGYQSLNDFGRYAYGGPCPPDEKPHHYVFRAYALDAILEINEGMTMKDLEKLMAGHIIAKDELIGVYRKPIW